VMGLAIREFNREIASKALLAIDQFLPTERDISSVVMGLSEKSYGAIKREIQEFYQRAIEIAHHDVESDKVFALALHLFPLTLKVDKNSLPEETA